MEDIQKNHNNMILGNQYGSGQPVTYFLRDGGISSPEIDVAESGFEQESPQHSKMTPTDIWLKRFPKLFELDTKTIATMFRELDNKIERLSKENGMLCTQIEHIKDEIDKLKNTNNIKTTIPLS